MTRDETIKLWQQCEDARAAAISNGKSEDEAHTAAKAQWNAWARGILGERKTLEDGGKWDIEFPELWKPLRGKNSETVEWLDKAEADFTGKVFSDRSYFSGFVFPGIADFSGVGRDPVVFQEDTWFNQAIFHDMVWFHQALFERGAEFMEALFCRDAGFGVALFQRSARFNRAVFEGAAGFGRVSFPYTASFEGATFVSTAHFVNGAFSANTHFQSAKFRGEALFSQRNFEGFTSFEGAIFDKSADFRGIQVQGPFSFDECRFGEPPNLIQAHFAEAPRLDNMRVIGRPFYGHTAGDRADYPARWRSMKRLAIQGHDTERELEFNAREIKSSRFLTDWPLHWRPSRFQSALRFWFGAFYETFSDFGRSIARPIVAWLFITLASATFYLVEHERVIGTPNVSGRSPGSAGEAVAV